MTDDAHEECFRQHDKMLRSLTAMLVKQDSMTYTKWENGARTFEGAALRCGWRNCTVTMRGCWNRKHRDS